MKERAENISHAILFIGLGILALLNSWWPGLLIVLGAYFVAKNGFSYNYFKMVMSAILFSAAYVCSQYPFILSWHYLLPIILFALGLERLLKEIFLHLKD